VHEVRAQVVLARILSAPNTAAIPNTGNPGCLAARSRERAGTLIQSHPRATL